MLTNYRAKETSAGKIANFDDIAIYADLCGRLIGRTGVVGGGTDKKSKKSVFIRTFRCQEEVVIKKILIEMRKNVFLSVL